jgi:hypothetical protein
VINFSQKIFLIIFDSKAEQTTPSSHALFAIVANFKTLFLESVS